MKVQGIRYFEIGDGFHTIKYMSEYPSSSPKYSDSISRDFNYNDWVNIKVYALSSGIQMSPEIEVNSGIPTDVIRTLDEGCATCRRMIDEDYKNYVKIVKNQRNNPEFARFPEKAMDEWEKGALEFLETVDKRCSLASEEFANWKGPWANKNSSSSTPSSGGCYVATCVYGSYDCPEVWTLRRFRDDALASTWYGRAFINVYYAISPTIVKCFGKTKWFTSFWKSKLDRMVDKLRTNGVEDTPYNDKDWK
jgi:hypothetical protein